MKTLLVRTAEKWRDWLDKHHASEAEVWLIFHKRHTGIASIAYKDALDRPPTERGYDPRPPRRSLPSTLPSYIRTALRDHPTALRRFEALAPSHRRRYFAWIESAKREETRHRRLEEAIRLLASGKLLGLK